MKLLLVEDSERLRDNLARGLRASGFTVDVAGDGVEANGYLAAYAYDFMVLDLGLPRLDGFGVLRALPAGGERARAGAVGTRPGWGSRGCVERRRRRLPGQAVRVRGTGRAPARAGAASSRDAGGRAGTCRRAAGCAGTPRHRERHRVAAHATRVRVAGIAAAASGTSIQPRGDPGADRRQRKRGIGSQHRGGRVRRAPQARGRGLRQPHRKPARRGVFDPVSARAKTFSLRARLTLLLALAVLVVFGVAAKIVDWRADTEMQQRFDASLLSRAQSLAALTQVENGRIAVDAENAEANVFPGNAES